jgi:hypothetical protein
MKGIYLDFISKAIRIKVFMYGFGELDHSRFGHAVTREVGHLGCARAGCHIDNASTAAGLHSGQYLHRCLYDLKLESVLGPPRRKYNQLKTYSAEIDLDVPPDGGVRLK